MKLPEVVTGDLARKFSENSLYNQHADFELGSDSNSNSTSPWAIACDPAIEPSCVDSPLHEHFPYGLYIASKPHAGLGRRSPPSTTRTPTPPPATTRTPPTSLTSGRTLTSPSPRPTRWINRCQDLHPAWYNIYTRRQIGLLARPQARRPDRRELTLRRLPRLTSLPGENPTSSN
jgi:hypothetical protein